MKRFLKIAPKVDADLNISTPDTTARGTTAKDNLFTEE